MGYIDYAAALTGHFEGFQPFAKWDVNAYRLGFGSDTEGPEQRPVTRGMTTTRERALANLAKRLPKFEAEIIGEVGAGKWHVLPDHAKGALLSLCYNYGHLPPNVAYAVAHSDLQHIAAAVGARQNDNAGVNSHRRLAEAAVIAASAHG